MSNVTRIFHPEQGYRITLGRMTRHSGMAGQYAYSVPVVYEYDNSPEVERSVATFVGSTYGGRVVAVMDDGSQAFVDQSVMDRCGATLSPEWIRRYFDSERWDGEAVGYGACGVQGCRDCV